MTIMNNARKVLVSLIAALLVVGLSFAASSSHNKGGSKHLARPLTTTPAPAQQKNSQPPKKNIQAQPDTMSAEEKLVRDVYARLMRYQSASRDEVDAKENKQSEPKDYLTFELRNFHSGPIQEIQDRQLGELATPPNIAQIAIKPVRMAASGGLQHAYYEAEWGLEPATAPAEMDPKEGAIKNNPRFAPFDHYTSYEVRVRLQGKSFKYRALVLYQAPAKGGEELDRLTVEIIDNVTSGMNTVYSDESALARAPWTKYSKTSLYRKVTKSLKSKLDRGETLIPKDAPIGYITGDGEFTELMPIEGDPPGDGGGGGGGTEPPCQATTVASLQASLPSTRNPVTNVAPAPGIYNTTNASMAFGLSSTADMATVFRSSETQLIVTAMGVNPTTAANTLRWRVDRDPTDTVDTGTPTLSTLVGPATVITPNLAGNFRLICYVDLNSNTSYDTGEEQRVMRFASVQATIQTSFIRTTAAFAGSPSGVSVNNAMDLSIDILLQGGGANRRIGTDKIVLGNVGNLWTADTFQVRYPIPVPTPPAPGNVAGTATENSGGPTPMVDSANITMGNTPTGSSTPFRSHSQENFVANGPGGLGAIRRVVSSDAPGFGWDFNHPTTTNPWGDTLGGNNFREFIVGYTVTFSPQRHYVVFAVGDWEVIATGNNTGGNWTSNGANVRIQGGTTSSVAMTNRISSVGAPQSGNTGGIQVLGLSFVSEFRMDYVP
jgi:hypothetical protein